MDQVTIATVTNAPPEEYIQRCIDLFRDAMHEVQEHWDAKKLPPTFFWTFSNRHDAPEECVLQAYDEDGRVALQVDVSFAVSA